LHAPAQDRGLELHALRLRAHDFARSDAFAARRFERGGFHGAGLDALVAAHHLEQNRPRASAERERERDATP
jgi:hypothetical protein